MKIKISAILLSLLLSACAHTPKQTAGETAEGLSPAEMSSDLSSMSADADKDQIYPKMALSSEMLYTFLLGDIAAQRGQPELAAQAYLELAKSTRDLRAVRRAAQLAYDSHQMEETLEAFKLWNELDPKAVMPKQMLATVLMSGGKLNEARPYLVELLAADPANAGRNFIQIYPLLARYADKLASYKMLQDLSKPYVPNAEIYWVLAQAAEAAAQHEAALHDVREARALRPEWEFPVLLEAQLLQKTTPLESLAIAKKFLSAYPDANEVRLFYARALIEQKQYEESRVQFQNLLERKPGNTEVAFAIALLSIQMGELDRAETELKQTLGAGRKDSATVHYYLGQLQEAKKDDAAALNEYRQVNEGGYAFTARLRMAYIQVKAGKVAEAREILHQTPAQTNEQRVQLILTEGQLLRDAKQYEQASKVLDKGLEKLPNHPDLLYEAAMVAEKMDRRDVFEKLLRKLIKVAPEHAHAYNALGYAFMERHERLEEAMTLVEKAYQLAPDDAAIMDSMGWGYYLLGKPEKGLEYIRKAYAAFPDPEIAAHMAEMLWHQGEHDEASSILRDNIKKFPESKALKTMIKKYLP